MAHSGVKKGGFSQFQVGGYFIGVLIVLRFIMLRAADRCTQELMEATVLLSIYLIDEQMLINTKIPSTGRLTYHVPFSWSRLTELSHV